MEFVGRAHELAALGARVDDLDAGRGSVVLLGGMPGSGKSALLETFGEQSTALGGVGVSVVSCSSWAEEPFSAFRRVARSMVEAETDLSEKKSRGYVGATGRAMLELGPEFVSLIFPPAGVVGAVGRHILKESGVLELRKDGREIDYRHSNRETFSDFVEFFHLMALSSPQIVVIDDLHWADEASMALFGRLAAFLAQEPSVPLLLIGSFRSYEVTADQGHPLRSIVHEVQRAWGDVVIDLEANGEVESYELTRQLIDGFAPNALDERFARDLFDVTDGNPLHVTEFLEAMVGKKHLVVNAAGDLVAGMDLDWDHVPTRLDAVLAERIDRLSPDANGVLSTAAVQGVDFSADVVAAARRGELDEVLPILTDDLDRSHALVKDLGFSDSEPTVFEFRFRAPEYQRFVYRETTDSARALAHRRVAESLVEIYEGAEAGIVLEVAQHFANAGQPRLAAPWYLRAASAALNAAADRDAYSIALDGLEQPDRVDPEVEAELQLIAGQTIDVLGEYSEATPHLRRALELSESLDNKSLGATSEVWLGVNLRSLNDDDAAWELLVSGLAKAQGIGDPELEYRAMLSLGVIARKRGDANRALLWYERAECVHRHVGRVSTATLNNRALVYSSLLGDLGTAHDLYAQALSIARAAGNRGGEALYLLNLASSSTRLGDQEAAIRLAEEGISVCRSIGNRRREALSREVLGNAYVRLEDYEKAIAEYLDANAISAGLRGRHRSEIPINTRLALALAHVGTPLAEVLPVAARAVSLQLEWNGERVSNEVLAPSTVLATLLAVSGETRQALDALEPDGQVIPSGDDPWWMRWQNALVSTIRASLNGDLSDRAEAMQRVRMAASIMSVQGAINDARELLAMLLPVASDDSFLQDVVAVLDSPPRRSSPAGAIEFDDRRLEELSADFREAVRQTRLEPYRTPLGGSDARRQALDALERGGDPMFTYEPVPSAYEEPLVELLRRLDPARSIWEELLYESAEDHLDLLLAIRSRDTDELTVASTGAFGSPTEHLVREARNLLQTAHIEDPSRADESTDAAVTIMREALSGVGLSSWNVTVSENMNAGMSVNFADDTVRIRSGSVFSSEDLRRLVVHEIGTHVFRAENGRQQPLALFGMGLGRNTATDEGLASYNEEQAGLANRATTRKYALRVIAADLALRYGFGHIFSEVAKHTTEEEAFEVTLRAKRGLVDTSQPGGFIKDHSYLDGLLQVKDAIELEPGAYNLLMSAKVPLRMLPILGELRESGVLVEPAFLPADLIR